MDFLGTVLGWVAGLVILVCHILVVVKMFQNGQVILGIVCIVLFPCCIGGLIAYVFGWMKSGEWGTRNIMIAWTAGWLFLILGGVLNPGQYTEIQRQIQQQNK